MSILFGEYPLKADAKGRFLLPAGLLRQLPPTAQGGDQFVLGRGLDPCLVLYPMGVWQAELQRLYGQNQFDPSARALARLYQSGAQPLSLDAQNRLLIPKPLWDELMAEAPDAPELTLIGAHDRIEIWPTARYRRWLAEQLPHLPALAQRVLSAPTPPTT